MNHAIHDRTIAALLRLGRDHLKTLDSAGLDAELLLASVLGRTRTWLHTWPEQSASASQSKQYLAFIERRAAGVPLAYLTGEREFWSLPLHVSEQTLVPRSETETLVAAMLPRVQPGHLVVDVGTGTGAVALAIGSERPGARMVASDISYPALAVARGNALRLHQTVSLVQSDWLTAFGDRCADIVVANPPYIAAGDPHLDHDGVRCEPPLALVSGTDGLAALRRIADQAPRCLRTGGWLALEHGADQAAAVRALLSEKGFDAIETLMDDNGLERVTFGCKNDRR